MPTNPPPGLQDEAPATPAPSDLARIALLPIAMVFGGEALTWMASFGQDPAGRLPLAALAFLGAMFADPLAQSLRRGGRSGALVGLAAVAAALVLGLAVSDPRHLTAPLVTVGLALALAALPRRAGDMWGAISVYTASTVLANYTLDAFLPVGPWFLVNMGTIFFGVTFTQRDRVHGFGRRVVYGMILFAAIANVVAAMHVGTPLRYVAVGFLAIVASETADTEVYARLVSRRWLVRVASSNAVSAPLDTILFTVLAFAGAPFATLGWMVQVVVTDVIVKYASGIVAALAVIGGRSGRRAARA